MEPVKREDPEQLRWRQLAEANAARSAFCASIATQKYPITPRQGRAVERWSHTNQPMRVHSRRRR